MENQSIFLLCLDINNYFFGVQCTLSIPNVNSLRIRILIIELVSGLRSHCLCGNSVFGSNNSIQVHRLLLQATKLYPQNLAHTFNAEFEYFHTSLICTSLIVNQVFYPVKFKEASLNTEVLNISCFLTSTQLNYNFQKSIALEPPRQEILLLGLRVFSEGASS